MVEEAGEAASFAAQEFAVGASLAAESLVVLPLPAVAAAAELLEWQLEDQPCRSRERPAHCQGHQLACRRVAAFEVPAKMN